MNMTDQSAPPRLINLAKITECDKLCFLDDRHCYIFGGSDGFIDGYKNFITRFNLFTHRIETSTPQRGHPLRARSGHCSANINGQLYIAGGWDGEKTFGDMWTFTLAPEPEPAWATLNLNGKEENSYTSYLTFDSEKTNITESTAEVNFQESNEVSGHQDTSDSQNDERSAEHNEEHDTHIIPIGELTFEKILTFVSDADDPLIDLSEAEAVLSQKKESPYVEYFTPLITPFEQEVLNNFLEPPISGCLYNASQIFKTMYILLKNFFVTKKVLSHFKEV